MRSRRSPSGSSDAYAKIYAVVESIPPGRVATYGQVAALAGLARHARQVGYALHATPEDLDIPWHRVINAKGEVSPRAEPGWDGYQRHLLEEEGIAFDANGRLDLRRYQWDPDEPRPRRRKPSLRALVADIETSLRPLGTPERAEGAKAYLKSDLDFLGVDTPALRATAKAWLKERPELTRPDLLRLVEALWKTRVHELWSFGIELLLLRPTVLESGDLDLLDRMLRKSNSWAYVDTIAIHLVGPLVERDPTLNTRLDRWLQDESFWLRRSALLALLLPLRRGQGDWPRFVRYADALLDEKEFFIRKAIGWVLREVSKKKPELVREYVRKREGRMSGVTRREAERYL